MKNTLLLALGLLATLAARAQATYPTLIGKALVAYHAKHYREAGQQYEAAFRQPQATPDPGDFYNAACSWALAGDASQAFRDLNHAIKAGWTNVAHLKADTDLTALHADKRWQPMLRQLEAAAAQAEVKINQPLKRELTEIIESDQRLRQQIAPTRQKFGLKSPEMDSLFQQMKRADDRNLPRVTAIIDQYGWPGKTLVGSDGSFAAFLVIQHSSLTTMQKYLPIMRQAAASGELAKQNLALVEDRVLTFQDQPQRYGSQYRYNAATGKPELFPIADEAHVDERRATMGLEPLADYAKGFGLNYQPATK